MRTITAIIESDEIFSEVVREACGLFAWEFEFEVDVDWVAVAPIPGTRRDMMAGEICGLRLVAVRSAEEADDLDPVAFTEDQRVAIEVAANAAIELCGSHCGREVLK